MSRSLWDVLQAMEDVELRWTRDENILRGARARWYPRPRILVIDSGLKQMVAYCTLAHELAHIILGHGGCDAEFFDQHHEQEADELAASWLIPDLDEFAVQIATSTRGHAAYNLRVTVDLLDARLKSLDELERARVRRKVYAVRDMIGA